MNAQERERELHKLGLSVPYELARNTEEAQRLKDGGHKGAVAVYFEHAAAEKKAQHGISRAVWLERAEAALMAKGHRPALASLPLNDVRSVAEGEWLRAGGTLTQLRALHGDDDHAAACAFAEIVGHEPEDWTPPSVKVTAAPPRVPSAVLVDLLDRGGFARPLQGEELAAASVERVRRHAPLSAAHDLLALGVSLENLPFELCDAVDAFLAGR